MKRFRFLMAAFATLGLTYSATAHFGMIIPSASVVEEKEDATLTVAFSFGHPMENTGMTLARPKSVHVHHNGQSVDLTADLKPAPLREHEAWTLEYTLRQPGVHTFVMEPVPYWEENEDCFIVHYTKTYVAAFGDGEGWDKPVGLKTEIVPLTRPFGNYVGNVFQGRVLLDGKPVPHAEVEVEYANRDGRYRAPNEQFTTQVVKADENGVFTYGIPFAGWWGFAALSTSDEKIERDGQPKDVELGAVLWAQFHAPVLNNK